MSLKEEPINNPMRWKVDWSVIDTILLDMDGTLLDKHFDDFFWEDYVPEQFAQKNGISVKSAKNKLLRKYKKLIF